MPRGKPRAKVNLKSKRVIDRLKTDNPRGERFYDAELRRFGITVYPSGRKVFFIDYGDRRRRRRMTLGEYGPLTTDRAYERARVELGRIIEGADPLVEKEARRAMPTVADWVDRWLSKFEMERKPRTVVEYRRYLDRVKCFWGTWPLDSVSPGDVRQAMEQVTDEARERVVERKLAQARKGSGNRSQQNLERVEQEIRKSCADRGVVQANRWLAAVRSCLGTAVREGVLEANPAMVVNLNREAVPRARVLDDDELKRLVTAIEQETDLYSRAAFRMLIETGARLREVLNARWEDIDLDAGTWRIPSPKAGYPQVAPLAQGTIRLLMTLPHNGPIVIAGRRPGKPRFDLKSSWKRVCRRAQLTGVNIHDIRRTFGLQVARKAGLHIASKLLRHGDVRITEKVYAPLGIDDLRAALEVRNQELAEVIPIRKTEAV